MPIIRGKYFQQRFPLFRITLTNGVAEFGEFDEPATPAAIREFELTALIDTGATNSIFDDSILSNVTFHYQGQKEVLLAGMELPIHPPVYACSLLFHEDSSPNCKKHEWNDWPDLIAMRLENRHYGAIIGMDIISKGVLKIDHGNQITFEY